MGWFEEQIRERKERDQEIFEDSILEMASAVVGKRSAGVFRDKRVITKAAIDEILKYYHFKPVDIPSRLKEPDEQLEYALRPHGIMYRAIELSEGWYKRAFGPVLAFRKESGLPLVVYPKRFGGYYINGEDGKRVSVGKEVSGELALEAICFYSPLPMRALKISDLIAYMKSLLEWNDYAFLAVLAFLATLAGTLIPRLTKMISGFVLESGSELTLWCTAVFMLFVLISEKLLMTSRELALTRIEIKVELPTEAALMGRLFSLPTAFFRDFSAGDLASRSSAVRELSTLIIGEAFSAAITAFMSLLYLLQIFRYTPSLGLPSLIVILLMLVISLITFRLKTKEEREFMEFDAKESGLSFSLISGIQKIKLAGAEKRSFARWAKIYTSGAETEYNPPLFLKLQNALRLAVSLLGLVAIYYLAAKAGISPSDYLAFSASYGALSGAFIVLADIAPSVAKIGPILEMAEPILKAEPEAAEGREIVTGLSGGLELSNVSFRYGEKEPYILKDLNLRVAPGEYIAVVGRTGCGKSTLLRLMLGFETPEKGTVYYDRKDIRTLDLPSLRRKLGVVTQDGSLFSGDIYSNIAVSAPRLSMEDAWDAAEKAGIAEDIRSMPMGMNTVIGEGQGRISGGQRQRLMIARAIAPKPKILMFDEATSALDNKTQRQVSEALSGLKCTRIAIAHRLSTVKDCDRILVLDGGKIAEEGSYDALIEKGGIFADLVERQRIDK